MFMKPTLVIGATENPSRYAYIAAERLMQHQHPVILFGKEGGNINGRPIETVWNPNWEVDTITLYVNPRNQESLLDKIVALKPERVIFNPGTENPVLIEMLNENGIEAEIACTLVLLSLNEY
ncbi:MAG: CoA-binding protein [Crocinitomicaceae bacterium]|jgi:predicted CoA-binding protein|nr:CoA-binding protein [Crocinitomicaceae bacterium]